MIRVLAPSLVLVVLLSGCATNAPRPPMHLPPAPSIPHGGLLQGRVFDETGRPLDEALVSLRPTEIAATTDGSGYFRFDGVASGRYLVVSHSLGYVDAEQSVDVGATGSQTIVLLQINSVGLSPGSRPHLDEIWGGRSERVVADKDVHWHQDNDKAYNRVLNAPTQPVASPCLYEGRPFGNNQQFFFDDPAQLVLPGTSQIVFTLSWTVADYARNQLTVAWKAPDQPLYNMTGWITNGVAYSLPVRKDMADSPYQAFSQWDFWLCVENTSTYASDMSVDAPDPKLVTGSIHVNAKIIKGWDVHIDPPPPVEWGADGRRTIVNAASRTFLSSDQWLTRDSLTWPFEIRGDPGSLVLSDAGVISVHLNWTATGLVENPAWSLTYLPADADTLRPFAAATLLKPIVASQGATWRDYIIKVQPRQADGLSQKSTGWIFYLNYEGHESEETWTNQCGCEATVAVHVDAVRSVAGA